MLSVLEHVLVERLSERGSNREKNIKKDYMNYLKHSYKPQRLANVKSRPIYVMEVQRILKVRSQYCSCPEDIWSLRKDIFQSHGVDHGYQVSGLPLPFVEMTIKSYIGLSEEHWASQIVSGLSGGEDWKADSTASWRQIKSALYCFLDHPWAGCTLTYFLLPSLWAEYVIWWNLDIIWNITQKDLEAQTESCFIS